MKDVLEVDIDGVKLGKESYRQGGPTTEQFLFAVRDNSRIPSIRYGNSCEFQILMD